jgi:hypothetical protein
MTGVTLKHLSFSASLSSRHSDQEGVGIDVDDGPNWAALCWAFFLACRMASGHSED